MNSDNLVQLAQKSFRIAVGATTSVVEVLQNPNQREANFSQIRSKLSERLEDWETKGEVTEQEARQFVNTMWQKREQDRAQGDNSTADTNFRVDLSNFPESISQFIQFTNRSGDRSTNSPASSSSTVDARVQTELQILTAQIAAMRAELEEMRRQG